MYSYTRKETISDEALLEVLKMLIQQEQARSSSLRIDMIKRCREVGNLSLGESKEVVDQILDDFNKVMEHYYSDPKTYPTSLGDLLRKKLSQ